MGNIMGTKIARNAPVSSSPAVMVCETCGLTQRVPALAPGSASECFRCGSLLGVRRYGVGVPAALALAALALYVPANMYPILKITQHGAYSESTIWDGVLSLMQHDQWLVAIVVFAASMVVPLMKLAGLFFLVATVRLKKGRRLRSRTRIYRFIDAIGPWAMLDVLLVAVLVALVKLGDIARVVPGPGLIAFTGVVVCTMLASASFDPRLIWEDK
jgi:paraquat-inducible protein A